MGVVNPDEIPVLLRPAAERLTGLGYEVDYKYLRPVGRPGYLALVGRGRLVAVKGDVRLRIVLFHPRLRLPDTMHFYRWMKLPKKTGELVEFKAEDDFWAFAERGSNVEQGNQADNRE